MGRNKAKKGSREEDGRTRYKNSSITSTQRTRTFRYFLIVQFISLQSSLKLRAKETISIATGNTKEGERDEMREEKKRS